MFRVRSDAAPRSLFHREKPALCAGITILKLSTTILDIVRFLRTTIFSEISSVSEKTNQHAFRLGKHRSRGCEVFEVRRVVRGCVGWGMCWAG